MKNFLWTPGNNMAVVSRNGVIILEPGLDTLGPAFWQALEEGVDLGTLLQFLTSAFAADLASLPNFAAIIFEGSSTHIAVRGAFEVTVAAEEGISSFMTGTVITWAEQRVHNVRGLSIAATLSATDTREEDLPRERIIASGVVPAATLVFGDLSAGPTAHASREDKADQPQEAAPSSEDTMVFADDTVNRTHSLDEDEDEEYGYDENSAQDAVSLVDVVEEQEEFSQSPAGGDLHSNDARRFRDGFTLPSRRARDLRHQLDHDDDDDAMEETAPDEDEDGRSVMAALCIHDHPNPTHAQKCRVCDGDVGEEIVRVPRPSLGTIVFSTGERIPLDRDIVIGRRPRYTPQPGRPEAHVVPVPSPNLEISRTHCEIKIDGWDVRVRDLGSNNGTFLLRRNKQPVRVMDSVPVIMRPGDVLDIGDDVTLRMEI